MGNNYVSLSTSVGVKTSPTPQLNSPDLWQGRSHVETVATDRPPDRVHPLGQ